MNALKLISTVITCITLLGCTAENKVVTTTQDGAEHMQHPYLYHLVQAELWNAAVKNNTTYYPPTYQQDGFTHATANPNLLMNVANHFYSDVAGEWLCLQMTTDSLAATGTKVIFEGTAPVGDKEANFEGTNDELFPHILGGILPAAVIEVHQVVREKDGTFLSVINVTDE